jgi:hypothetical protein
MTGQLDEALGWASAVPADEVAEKLPEGPGLYAIWGDVPTDLQSTRGLLYVGKTNLTVGVRRRVLSHLHLPGGKSRPNETLILLLLDGVLRPNMQADHRTCVQIALDFLRARCLFAGWAWDGTDTLGIWESQAIVHGVGGHRPILNWPAHVAAQSTYGYTQAEVT